MARESKEKHYLRIARSIGERSPCLRRKFGAIVVKNDAIASSGYNGPARKSTNCPECLKDIKDADHWERYDLCPAVHAEENAVINAARHGVNIIGGTLYIIGKDVKKGEYTKSHPCDRCKRVLINAGIEKVVTENRKGEIIKYYPQHWAEKEKVEYKEEIEEAKKEE